jgi:uncharacterized repeat protein (TIGR03803 family)
MSRFSLRISGNSHCRIRPIMMSNLGWWKTTRAVFLVCAATTITARAQTLATLYSFDYTDGANPQGTLVQATNGDFYGTTIDGGAASGCSPYGCGTIFKITPGSTLTTLYSFCSQSDCADGELPAAGLIEATDGNFYGTTRYGGANVYGTVFRITPGGTLNTLYSFCAQSGCADGQIPAGGLIQATDGNFYGTTVSGGVDDVGTIFKITPTGKLTTLSLICPPPYCNGPSSPGAGLIQATDGNFYGTTSRGGTYGYGTVFKVTPSGRITVLYSFCSQDPCLDGGIPQAPLVQATDGDLYGTTTGVADGESGTVFKITLSGTLTTLHNFCSQNDCADGSYPAAGLIQATNGNFYGTTTAGGTSNNCDDGSGCGTIFDITTKGDLTTLYNFCTCIDGYFPFAQLVQGTNGTIYGTTLLGGLDDCVNEAGEGCGTIFGLSLGLGPFVKTLPVAGKVGSEVGILGTKLTGATSITFNGTTAQFKVSSPTLILTHVPSGATTGKIKVTLPSKTLTSNVKFHVLK